MFGSALLRFGVVPCGAAIKAENLMECKSPITN